MSKHDYKYKLIYSGSGQSVYNNKYCCVFKMTDSDGTIMSEVNSAAVWDTSKDAEDAGVRAFNMFNETGFLPNLSSKW